MHVLVHEIEDGEPQCSEGRQRQQWCQVLQKYLKYNLLLSKSKFWGAQQLENVVGHCCTLQSSVEARIRVSSRL